MLRSVTKLERRSKAVGIAKLLLSIFVLLTVRADQAWAQCGDHLHSHTHGLYQSVSVDSRLDGRSSFKSRGSDDRAVAQQKSSPLKKQCLTCKASTPPANSPSAPAETHWESTALLCESAQLSSRKNYGFSCWMNSFYCDGEYPDLLRPPIA